MNKTNRETILLLSHKVYSRFLEGYSYKTLNPHTHVPWLVSSKTSTVVGS